MKRLLAAALIAGGMVSGSFTAGHAATVSWGALATSGTVTCSSSCSNLSYLADEETGGGENSTASSEIIDSKG